MIRDSILAGSWYPKSADEITAVMMEYLRTDRDPVKAFGVVSPHAGWRYSGKVAGQVFASVNVPDTVIVIAPNHRGVGSEKSIWNKGRWQIPNGSIPVNTELADLVVKHADLVPDTFAHQAEHSLEIQLPFIYFRNPNVTIVPVCLMAMPPWMLKPIGSGMAAAIKEYGKEVLIVASSDMSHYISADMAKRLDFMAIEKVKQLDADGLYSTVRENDISMCGVIPVATMILAARELGATGADLVAYATSGDVTGDYNEIVAYAGMIIT
jgi:AmmeMemoRadiSam system protein B